MAIHREVPVGRSGLVALVDEEDYEMVAPYRWGLSSIDRLRYARRFPQDGGRFMHNLIMGTIGIDHRNHNGLDNRRANLRVATPAQNQANQRPQIGGASRFKGVSWQSRLNKWQATLAGQYLGIFVDEKDAALAYDNAARQIYGEFAYTNLEEFQ